MSRRSTSRRSAQVKPQASCDAPPARHTRSCTSGPAPKTAVSQARSASCSRDVVPVSVVESLMTRSTLRGGRRSRRRRVSRRAAGSVSTQGAQLGLHLRDAALRLRELVLKRKLALEGLAGQAELPALAVADGHEGLGRLEAD